MLDMTVIYDLAIVALRILMPVYAIIIVYQCYAAMRRRRRPEKPLVTLYNTVTGLKLPVIFWENSIGRSRASDIVVDDPAVSRNHCVLLRRASGWYICDTGSKGGTYVNGEEAVGRTRVLIDDVISVGNSQFQFLRGEDYDENLRYSWFFKKANNKPAMKSWKLMVLITLFHFFMCVEAVFWQDGTNKYSPLVLFGCLAVAEWTFFFVSSKVLKRVSFELESLALFLTGVGVMLLVRQVERSAYVQLIAAVVGMALFCVIIKFIEDPDRTSSTKLRYGLMIAAVGLLGVSIVFGKITYGAANWVKIGGISLQPSEIVKIIYIFIGANTLDRLQTKKNLFEFIIFSAVCVGLLALMGDFGTALIFFMTFLLISFMRSGDFKTVILAIVAAVFGVSIVLRFKSYVLDRFKAWGHAWEYANDLGYQQTYSGQSRLSAGKSSHIYGKRRTFRRRHRQRLFKGRRSVGERPRLWLGFRRNGCNCCNYSRRCGSLPCYLCKSNHNKKQKYILFYFCLLCCGFACNTAFTQCFWRNRYSSAYRCNIPVHQLWRFKCAFLLGTYCIYQGGRRKNICGEKIILQNRMRYCFAVPSE